MVSDAMRDLDVSVAYHAADLRDALAVNLSAPFHPRCSSAARIGIC